MVNSGGRNHETNTESETGSRESANDTLNLPVEETISLLKEQSLEECKLSVIAEDGVEDQIDKQGILEETELNDSEYAHGELHAWGETTVTLKKQVSRASRLEPEEYQINRVPCYVSIRWDLSPATPPTVDIEVVT